MDRKEMLRMDTVYIPSNYTDAGKLLGAFALRQVAECAAICLPLAAMVFLTLVAGAVLHTGRPIVPGLLLVLPLRGEALAMEADVRELRRLRGRLPGARIVLADWGLTRDARALAAYLADRAPGVALTDGAVIRLDENEHTKEEEHGRAGHL